MTTPAVQIYNPPMPEESDSPAAPVMPHNREAEEGVVGSVLINSNCLYDLAFLKPEHFYIHRLRWLWEAFKYMEARRVPIDLLTIADEMERRGTLAEIGGPAFITSLINASYSSLNAETYGRIVEGCAVRRQIIEGANKAAQLAYNDYLETAEVVRQVKENAEGIEIATNSSDFIQLRDLFSMTYDDTVERSKNPRDVWGFATGLPALDKETGGIQRGELTYLPGQSGVGKTWLMLGWAMEFGKQAPGTIISMEMKKLPVGRRMLSGDTGVRTRAMKSGHIDSGDLSKLLGAIGKYDKFPVWFDDHIYDTDSLFTALRFGKREFGWEWLLLDYALLLADRGGNEIEKTDNIAFGLNRIKQELDIAVVVLHHLTKTGADSAEPRQGDQRGSQRQVDGADLQLFLKFLDEKDPAIAERNFTPEQKKNMRTLWCTKGKEIEESNFKAHLVRRPNSPFWGELETKRAGITMPSMPEMPEDYTDR